MTSAKVLSDLIAEFEESLSSWKGKPNVLLPTAPQFYQMGLVLSNVIDNSQSQDNIEQEGDVVHVYRTLLDGFPVSHLRAVLEDLHEAFGKTLEMFVDENNHDYDDTVDVQMAVQSLHGLYGTNARALLVAASGHPTAGWSLSKLQLLDATYDKLNRCLHHNSTANEGENQTDRATTISKTQEHLLVIIASLLEEPTIDFEELLPAINHLQERKNKDEKSTWEQLVKYKATYAPGWKEAMVGRYTEMAHKGYLLSMFTSVEEEEEPASMTFPTEDSRTKQSNTTNTKKAKASSPQDTIQRLVQQVQSVFPHLGEGYVETALSQYRGDVERTMSALVEGQSNPASLPIVLQRLDPKLPARWKGPTSKQSKEDDEEARRITLQAVQTMEQQQEGEARALQAMLAPTHDEYNDDYDDQYDDIDGGMSADTGLYDDYDTVRTYNKMMKQVEEEQAFWVCFHRGVLIVFCLSLYASILTLIFFYYLMICVY